jgi:hypothetical protein
MATKRYLVEVEEGNTLCDECPYEYRETCCYPYRLYRVMSCGEHNLATMKIKELEEEK